MHKTNNNTLTRLEDVRYHDLRRRKEQIVTYVSSGLQKQSNKAGHINNQIIENI